MALEQIAGPEDLISDWYLYKDSPTDGGFIYPGPVSINGQPKLFSFAKKLNSLCIQICEEDLKNPEKVMQAHKFDATQWDLISCKNNLWNAPSGGDTKMVMYQSKITVKPKKDFSWTEDYIKNLFDNIKARIGN